jgi:hypothetical protein
MREDIKVVRAVGEGFVYHQAIVDAFASGWDITVGSDSLVAASSPYSETDTERQFESFIKYLDGWVKMGVSVKTGSSKVRYWLMSGYGRTSIFKPSFIRQSVEAVISGSTQHLVNIDEFGGTVVHGQGTPPVCFDYDFDTEELTILSQQHSSVRTHYCPKDGNQTGGNWHYMGITFPIANFDIGYWRDQLYPLGNYGGTFVDDDGTWATEAEWPNAVLAGGTHFHRDTKTWIKYTHERDPWRDKGSIRTPDMQHLSLQDPVCQAYIAHPDDIGLRWLVEIAANRYLMQVPGWDKGTYRWDPGQARANGRVEKAATNLFKALMVMGRTELALAVGVRGMTRLQNQIVQFAGDLRNGRTPWPYFEGEGKHSPAEIGIWWWGLNEIDEMLEEVGVQIPELDYIKDEASRFVFDSFYIAANGKVDVPYFVRTDWSHDLIPSGGEHFCYLAARNAHIVGAEDERKMELIHALADDIEPRFKDTAA